jgi:NACalpha-BTF3-like transcription factor
MFPSISTFVHENAYAPHRLLVGESIRAKLAKLQQSPLKRMIIEEDKYPTFCFPEEVCVEKVTNDYLCPICQGLLQNAVVDCCGHAYCVECFQRNLEMSNKCPKSNLVLNSRMYVPNLNLQNIIKEMQVYCTMKIKGCEWEDKLDKLKTHVEEDCLFVRIRCKNSGCTKFELASAMKEHEEICSYGVIKCLECALAFLRKDFQHHQTTCPEKVVQCVYECGKEYKRRDQQHHDTHECPNAIVPCDFASIGCLAQFSRNARMQHMKENIIEHQAQSLQMIHELREEIVKLKKENAKLKKDKEESKSESESKSGTEYVDTEESRSEDASHEEEKSNLPDNSDEEGLEASSLENVIRLASCSRRQAARALRESRGDEVSAIINLTS